MSAHTPGPWTIGKRYPCRIIAGEGDGRSVVGSTVTPADEGTENETEKANAARIVACVNACEGMDDPAEAILQLREEITARVQIGADGLTDKERELAAALRDIADASDDHLARSQARAALAKLGGR